MLYKNEFEEYDRLLKKYINSVVDTNGVNVFSLDSIPTENTLFTIINDIKYYFKPGDEVVTGEHIFYKLISIDNNIANWLELGEGVKSAEIVTVNIFSNQLSTEDLYGTQITVGEVTKTYQGLSLVFQVPYNSEYTITSSNVEGYSITNDTPGTVSGTRLVNLTYSTEIVNVSVTKENVSGEISNPTLTLSIDGNSISNPTFPYKVPYGSSYTVEVTDTIAGYTTPASVTNTASQSSRTVEFEYKEIHIGVFAYYNDGSLKSYEDADSNAIGVAVITDNCSFIIDKVATNNNNYAYYGGYYKDLSSTAVTNSTAATAKLDFRGELNTTNIINACAGYNDGTSTGAPAAEACRAAFDGHGYMGSLGEWLEAYNNKSAVDLMMTKIGGTSIYSKYYWTSTHYNASDTSWNFHWGHGNTLRNNRDGRNYVRAFRAL